MDPITLFFVNLVIGLAFNYAASLLKQGEQQQLVEKKPGVRGTVTVGGDEPLSFIIGRYGTAGHKEYAGTWGSDGDTPNAFYSLVVSVSDIPVRGLARVFVDGSPVTLGASPNGDLGYPVTEYTRSGVQHLWVKFYDGTQTVVDPLLLARFGAHPDIPWDDDMIGRGIAYAIVTARVNRELFPGLPDPFFEIDGIEIDDPRDEDGQDNPVVMIHQVLSGLYYGDEWLWGLQGLPATRLPASNWPAQMDKCDVAIDLVGGGTEPRFRAGAEIRVHQQPIEVIGELLNSCNGRIAEIGGAYKVLVGEPDAPVVSFTDEDILITEGQSFEPFPGLESTFNGVNATYPEPAEKWGLKDAPALRNESLEADDDDRRLPASVSFPMVSSGTQVQRLMRAMHYEDRRFRTHTQTMPPEWWEYEVLDTAEWTSGRNGYGAKLFLITLMDDLPNGNQFIGTKEQEPGDFDWDPETNERAYSTVPLAIARPAPQLMTGWQALPATMLDEASVAWLPTIEVQFDGGLVDVRAVRVQVREAWGDKRQVFDGELPYYDPTETEPSTILNGSFVRDAGYEVRGIYVPFSGRAVRWSNQDIDGTEGAWLGVTTPDVAPVPPGSISPTELATELNNAIGLVNTDFPGSVPDRLSVLEALAEQLAANQMLGNVTNRQRLSVLVARLGGANAAVIRNEQAIVDTNSALAALSEEVVAVVDDALGSGLFKIEASVVDEDVEAAALLKVRAAVGQAFSEAAIRLRAIFDGGENVASVEIMADRLVFISTAGDIIEQPFTIEDGVVKLLVARAGRITSADGTSMIVDFDDLYIKIESA